MATSYHQPVMIHPSTSFLCSHPIPASASAGAQAQRNFGRPKICPILNIHDPYHYVILSHIKSPNIEPIYIYYMCVCVSLQHEDFGILFQSTCQVNRLGNGNIFGSKLQTKPGFYQDLTVSDPNPVHATIY